MKDLMAEAGLKPPVFEVDTFFHAVFYRDQRFSLKKTDVRVLDKVLERVPDKVLKRVTENQQEIIKHIHSNKFITTKELSKKVGISERKIRTNIRKLKELGIMKRIGSDRAGHWEVKR